MRSSCEPQQHGAVLKIEIDIEIGNERFYQRSANADRATEAALLVDDLATLARRHTLAETDGADLLLAADLVGVMHIEPLWRVDEATTSLADPQRVRSQHFAGRTQVAASSADSRSTVWSCRCESSSRRDVRGAWSTSLGPKRGRPLIGRATMDEVVSLDVIEQRIDYRFQDRSPLMQALVHASIASTRVASNERLEFLGDAILGAVVCEHLYRRFPDELEGELTKIKSNAVSRRVCAEVAVELGLADAVQLGKGMGDRAGLPQSLLAALFESVVGAVYLDGGIEPARAFILRSLCSRIEDSARLGHQQNFKSVLQQSLQQREMGTPQYVILDEKGPDHAKCFEVCIDLGGRRFPSCWGMSKKAAEQLAALEALVELGFVERSESGEVRLLPEA